MEKIRFKTKVKIDCATLPGKINLPLAYLALKKLFEVKYEPEIISAMHIKVNQITFTLWASGKITVAGKNAVSLEEKVFNDFFETKLYRFIENKPNDN